MMLSAARALLVLAVLAIPGCNASDRRSVVAAPPAEENPPAYVGVWAEQPQLCGRSEWRIKVDTLESDSGQACVLKGLRPSAAGWGAMATCAHGPFGAITLRTVPESSATLVLDGGPWVQPVTLVRCPAGEKDPARDPYGVIDMAAIVDLKIARGDAGLVEHEAATGALVKSVWRRGNYILKITEPYAGGGPGVERAYYFLEGEEQPFFIRDHAGAYGFALGRLVSVFTPQGYLTSISDEEREARESRLLRHARLIKTVAENEVAKSRPAGRV